MNATHEAPVPKRTCALDGCDRRHNARGLCITHYAQWQRHGTPTPPFEPMGQGAVEERFWSRVEKLDTCWLWRGFISKRGYGSYCVANSPWGTPSAHRIAWILCRGPIPDGMTLDHLADRCGNKHCVNPDHLEVVTALENHRRWADGITHCGRGHEFTPENTYTSRQGWRRCRTCVKASRQKYYQHRR